MSWIVMFFIVLGTAKGWNGREKRELEEYLTPQEKKYYFGDGIPDYEIVYPPDPLSTSDLDFPYDLTAFGNEINLRLRPNDRLISPNIKVAIRNFEEIQHLNQTIPNCHYLHKDETTAAALSFCEENQMHGVVFLPNDTLEIQPIPRRLHPVFVNSITGNSIPHIVRRAPYIPDSFVNDALPLKYEIPDVFREKRDFIVDTRKKRLTIESALFFDEAGYRIFAPYFEYDVEKIRDMLLAYVNGVQALYHHPSLGQPFDIVLVRLEIFKRQPSDLPHYNGERNQLLDSFCAYNQKHNPKGDHNPQHWDMGLYVSGLDFFAYENGRKSSITMGLATVGGVCMEKYNCIISELGTTNIFGKPYPSAGFTSVYILAHEMGHNIGMHHDSTGNNCPKEGYIMSPSRGTNGETLWSSCSAGVVSSMSWAKCLEDSPGPPPKGMDHAKYEDLPGQTWGAKKQCEVLLRDKDATLYNPDRLQDICENLQCRSPHRSGFYFAGPALEGTNCGVNKWCQGGVCVLKKRKKPDKVVKGGWSDWAPIAACSSGCIEKARGYQQRRRTCTNPRPVNSDEGCEGPGYDVVLCKDEKICKKKRKTVSDYATMKCQEFSKMLPELDKNAAGLQAPHEDVRLWMGCAIFCRRKDEKSFYTPRLDLNDLGVDPYFPDGTWCHNDGKMNYYCLQHHCLPENFKFVKGAFTSEDVPLPQNAPPEIKPPSDEILQYLSIDSNRKPLLTTLKPGQTKPPSEDEWVDHDYIEMPDFRQVQPTYYAMR